MPGSGIPQPVPAASRSCLLNTFTRRLFKVRIAPARLHREVSPSPVCCRQSCQSAMKIARGTVSSAAASPPSLSVVGWCFASGCSIVSCATANSSGADSRSVSVTAVANPQWFRRESPVEYQFLTSESPQCLRQVKRLKEVEEIRTAARTRRGEFRLNISSGRMPRFANNKPAASRCLLCPGHLSRHHRVLRTAAKRLIMTDLHPVRT